MKNLNMLTISQINFDLHYTYQSNSNPSSTEEFRVIVLYFPFEEGQQQKDDGLQQQQEKQEEESDLSLVVILNPLLGGNNLPSFPT